MADQKQFAACQPMSYRGFSGSAITASTRKRRFSETMGQGGGTGGMGQGGGKGNAVDLCLVAARRARPAETSLHGTGPDAAAVFERVRTYA